MDIGWRFTMDEGLEARGLIGLKVTRLARAPVDEV
jgi:hypothetical protein